MSKPISLRAYAAHRGVHLSSVQEAIAVGRLAACILRDAAGRPKITSAAAADDEWKSTTKTLHIPDTVRERKTGRAVAAVSARLERLVRSIATQDLEAALDLVKPFVEGAAAQLEKTDTEPTEAALLDALDLRGDEDSDAGVQAYGALLEITLDSPAEPRRPPDAHRAARLAGAAAARAEGGSDGAEG